MSKKAKPLKSSRREFLRGAAVVGGAATLAVVARGGAAEVQSTNEVAAAPEKSKGYHVTPHIRAYYEKLRD